MPALGESVTEGTVTRWLKAVGDTVAADEPLLEVSTDKVDTEIPAPAAGVLLAITVGEDETVAVGAELGVIGSARGRRTGARCRACRAAPPLRRARRPSPPPPPHRLPRPPRPPRPLHPPAAAAPAAPAANADAYVTPLSAGSPPSTASTCPPSPAPASAAASASRTCSTPPEREAGCPRGSLPRRPGSDAAPATTTAAPAAASPLRGSTEKMSRLRKVIAERMVESLQVSAQLTTVVEVDVTRIANLRARVKGDFEAREGVKLSFLPFFCKAAVEALKQFPQVNATLNMDEGTVTYHEAEHLGVAVDTERGLLVPVIRDAGDLNIAGLARRIADLADRTRTNKLSPDELSGGTFTVTNTGSRGALFDTPIINQPQVAILGTGAVVKRPVVVKDDSGAGRHRDPVDGLPRADLRPPPRRRRRRRPLPRGHQGPARGGRLRGRARPLALLPLDPRRVVSCRGGFGRRHPANSTAACGCETCDGWEPDARG